MKISKNKIQTFNNHKIQIINNYKNQDFKKMILLL